MRSCANLFITLIIHKFFHEVVIFIIMAILISRLYHRNFNFRVLELTAHFRCLSRILNCSSRWNFVKLWGFQIIYRCVLVFIFKFRICSIHSYSLNFTSYYGIFGCWKAMFILFIITLMHNGIISRCCCSIVFSDWKCTFRP